MAILQMGVVHLLEMVCQVLKLVGLVGLGLAQAVVHR
jgi:hypothetical protein